MFIGSVPREVVTQLLRVTDIRPGDEVFVCCSGSFRVDLAVKAAQPEARVLSNDVSLLSCALGALLTGGALPFRFVKELAGIEDALVGRGYLERIAGLLVAMDALGYNVKTTYGQRHRAHLLGHCGELMKGAKEKLEKHFAGRAVDSFEACDFRDHAKRAEVGGLVVGFPPTYKCGYERLYKRLQENVEWQEPTYRIWDPRDMAGWLGELREAGVRHCVFVDHEIPGERALASYARARSRPIYLYGNAGRQSSLRRSEPKSSPFAYEPVDPGRLTAQSEVAIGSVENGPFNFLRNKYLAKGIAFVDAMYHYLVFLDGRLAGGFALSRDKMGSQDSIYLLSDFSIRRERRLAKLIAMLATSGEAVRSAERKMLLRFSSVYTTVFTDKPVSMKYRGIFDLKARKPGFLQYASSVRRRDAQSIYREWFERYA